MIHEYDFNSHHYVRHFNTDDATNAGIADLFRAVAKFVEITDNWVAEIAYQSDGVNMASVSVVLSH